MSADLPLAELPEAPDDPQAVLAALLQRRSVTPEDDGALEVVAALLDRLGFTVHRLVFQAPGTAPIKNLYARLGSQRPNFCFAGHTDVVPPGDEQAWMQPPFAAAESDGCLWGRGAVDMKGGVAACLAALARQLGDSGAPAAGSLSLLITGDEEGPGTNGTPAVLDWLAERGEAIDACLVGEPTNPDRLGEAVKIGRRGSLNARVTATGVQGHAGYPAQADNPLPRLARIAQALAGLELDAGTRHFEPSTLALTALETGNPAPNVIPASAELRFNVRFNDAHSPDGLKAQLQATIDAANAAAGGGQVATAFALSGEAFVTEPGALSDAVARAVHAETGRTPALSTAGGTSDARFIRHHCPVVEFGLVGRTMHQIDERCDLDDLEALTRIYGRLLAGPPAG